MTRRAGSRNRGYDATRLELAARMRACLAGSAKQPSYAELAGAAGVSLATLRHYFGRRDQAVAAVLELHGPLGLPFWDILRRPSGPFAPSMRAAAEFISQGLSQPVVAALHFVGLSEGLGHAAIGPSYLRSVLEPTILALEERLAAHMATGEMRQGDPRAAALALISPLVLAHLHQGELGGAQTRPLDREAFLASLVDGFVRSYSRAR